MPEQLSLDQILVGLFCIDDSTDYYDISRFAKYINDYAADTTFNIKQMSVNANELFRLYQIVPWLMPNFPAFCEQLIRHKLVLDVVALNAAFVL